MVNENSRNLMSVSARPSRNFSHVTFSTSVNSTSSGSLVVGTSSSAQAIANNIHLSVSGMSGSHSVNTNSTEETGAVRNVGWYVKSKARAAEFVTVPAKTANGYIWKRLEAIVERMQDEGSGVTIRTVKSLMSTVPSVFTGADLIAWVMRHLGASDSAEACHLASMIASMGYLFPIVDHLLAVRNDAHTLYRFQTPCLYPSRCLEADNIEYAVYLCKRTMQNKQRLELADFEAERLATLQSFYWHKWEFIYLQAEAEAKVDKKRDKVERLVLESQEKGFWDAARPVGGAVNNNDIDMRKLCRAKRPKRTGGRPSWLPVPTGPDGAFLWSTVESACTLPERVSRFKACEEKKRVRVSKAVESLHAYHDLYFEYDLLLLTSILTSDGIGGLATTSGSLVTNGNNSNLIGSNNSNNNNSNPSNTAITTGAGGIMSSSMTTSITNSINNLPNNPNNSSNNMGSTTAMGACNNNTNNNIGADTTAINPWITDTPEFWIQETTLKDVSARRVRRWGFSIHELLKDPAGHEEIQKWLEREFSAENLKFWEACQELKAAPLREVGKRVDEIYTQFLSPNAVEPLNVDSRVADSVRQRVSRSNSSSNSSDRRYCFEEAEEHIFKLMTSDSYYRFLRSNVYKEMIAGQKKKSKRKFPADIKQRLEIE